ncbi:MAG: hypothetical protein GX665_03550 [Gammaproteobacteria bacterium]|nr:hypothetical protein [Gammaproteobacteria bacterium]
MQDMQDSLAKLQETKKNTSPKKAASQKAAMLKQRLETLKSVMQKMPPGDYKILAQEIKQIAKELAALSKQLGKSSPAVNLPIAMQGAQNQAAASIETVPDAEIAPDVTVDVAAAQIPVEVATEVIDEAQVEATPAAGAETVAATEVAEAEQLVQQAEATDKANTNKPQLFTNSAEDDEDDKQLRSVLAESKKLLKEVLNLLKAKHQNNDKESRKIIASIERDLATLDRALDVSGLDLPDVVSVVEGNVGGFVDTTA